MLITRPDPLSPPGQESFGMLWEYTVTTFMCCFRNDASETTLKSSVSVVGYATEATSQVVLSGKVPYEFVTVQVVSPEEHVTTGPGGDAWTRSATNANNNNNTSAAAAAME